MPNGRCSPRGSASGRGPGARVPWPCGKWSTRSSTCCGPAASGGSCLTTSPTGAPCAITTTCGCGTAPGCGSTRRGVRPIVNGWGGRRSPAPWSWTASRPGPPRAAANGGTTAAKKVVGRNRFVLVDTAGHVLGGVGGQRFVRGGPEGPVLGGLVAPADWTEQEGGRALLAQLVPHLPRLLKVW